MHIYIYIWNLNSNLHRWSLVGRCRDIWDNFRNMYCMNILHMGEHLGNPFGLPAVRRSPRCTRENHSWNIQPTKTTNKSPNTDTKLTTSHRTPTKKNTSLVNAYFRTVCTYPRIRYRDMRAWKLDTESYQDTWTWIWRASWSFLNPPGPRTARNNMVFGNMLFSLKRRKQPLILWTNRR